MRAFGAETTTDEVLAGIDLRGRVALVTGASGGLGAETARALASAGAAVTLTARDAAKGEAIASDIRESTGNDAVDVGELHLEQPESVRAFVDAWRADRDRLHILVNNAGVMACPLARTAEGWEMQFATNHLGHFLLALLLAPALQSAGAADGDHARVVSVSSAGHRMSPVVFDDVHFERRPYDKWSSYGQSKTANVLFAFELDRRLALRGVRANALHPGAILTDLGRHMARSDLDELQARNQGRRLQFKSVPAGAATSVWAASAPELEGRGGLYLEDCGVAGPKADPGAQYGYEAYARDPAAARALWDLSEETLGVRMA